jgi:hypothetical protein
MSGLAGAAFGTGMGGFFGACGIGALSNGGAAAWKEKSWGNIGLSAFVGGASAGIGYSVKNLITNKVYGSNDMSFSDYREVGKVDGGLITSGYQAELEALWLQQLREKYPVNVNQKILKKVKKNY